MPVVNPLLSVASVCFGKAGKAKSQRRAESTSAESSSLVRPSWQLAQVNATRQRPMIGDAVWRTAEWIAFRLFDASRFRENAMARCQYMIDVGQLVLNALAQRSQFYLQKSQAWWVRRITHWRGWSV